MTTKLVSANMGIILVVEQDGEEKTVQFSARCPDGEYVQPLDAIMELAEFINIHLGTDLHIGYDRHPTAKIAKPKRIKAPRPVSQNEFNKKIQELGYKP